MTIRKFETMGEDGWIAQRGDNGEMAIMRTGWITSKKGHQTNESYVVYIPEGDTVRLFYQKKIGDKLKMLAHTLIVDHSYMIDGLFDYEYAGMLLIEKFNEN